MRVVVQRCSRAEVRIDGDRVGQIEKGFVLLVGITDTDSREHADLLAKKIAQLRVFEDPEGKMNLAINEVGGAILSSSPFMPIAAKATDLPSSVQPDRKRRRPYMIISMTPCALVTTSASKQAVLAQT